ncbi:LysR family transcriptional regulator [Mycolicibacterium brumae]|uniref:Probable hydrogen peroxide-inducible genes activator n=1 Tax=Mycolicibacterium brumae TaxID=85968 RepID=A0A2G5P893_9MYCO|nr:LysR family transcriptional regulator [Mycolicibacterium brumae]MCV7191300.1 LysR family transcriptional regulator [Mycolicibacterium brumae]PIB74578.1 LysR family transcriptional regulator [Mycolicibacterium brumae]RWA18957.1 LysR family transcriptional regulator [Mycolicibacterium brumae DSM 44177]UWW09602.1 LysR family transcriptional regulator [Mycolicibacterium brumae]
MDWTLRELRFFVTAADAGSFTDAASQLHVSQAAVSRTIAGLEKTVGAQLLRRVPRGCEPTSTGGQILPHARRVLAEAQSFTEFLTSRHGVLRLGYAWAAVGRHTARLQRDWAARHPDIELQLIRHNSPSSGLAEGLCDVAITRRPVDDARFDAVIVGLERRLAAFASDDPQWSRRRQLRMDDFADRTIVIDPRVGNTSARLWAHSERQPQFIEFTETDVWLDLIAAGRAVGTTAEATAHHHPRPGVTYRPITDGPRIPVTLIWWHDHRPRGLDELVDALTQLYATG